MFTFARPAAAQLDAGQPSTYEAAILFGLSLKPSSDIYQGTVPAKTVARRRAANKVARASRRANRRR